MFKKFVGKKEYSFECLNLNRHIQKLLNNNVSLFNIARSGKQVSFQAYAEDDKKITKEFKNAHMLKCENKTGVLKLYDIFKKNLLVILSFAVCFLTFPFFDLFVWNVKVFAYDDEVCEEIKSSLSKINVKKGKLKSSYNLAEIKSNLLGAFSSIALVDVEIENETLIISAKEKTVSYAQFQNCKPVVCMADGIVESVRIESGTAKVKAGDIVREGDILVEAYLKRDGNFIPCEAVGEVVVRSFKTFEKTFSENMTVFSRTGNKYVKNYFTFFKDFDRIKLGKSRFENFETEIVLENSKAFPILPLKLTSVCFYELEQTQSYVNFEENKTQILADFRNETLEKLGSVQIADEKVDFKKESDGVYILTCYLEFFKTY